MGRAVAIRILIAVVGFAIAMVLIPAVLEELTVHVSTNLHLIIRVCCAVLALYYIGWGKYPPNPAP